MSFAGFEGSGSALHHIAWGHLTVRSVLTLGVPTLVRGEHANDKYEAERKMTWSELFFDLIFVTGVRRLGDMMREGLGDDETPTAKEGEGAEPDADLAAGDETPNETRSLTGGGVSKTRAVCLQPRAHHWQLLFLKRVASVRPSAFLPH